MSTMISHKVDNITKVLFRKQAYNLSGEMLQ